MSKCCEISRRYFQSATESELEEESGEGDEANDLDGIPATASAETSQFASEGGFVVASEAEATSSLATMDGSEASSLELPGPVSGATKTLTKWFLTAQNQAKPREVLIPASSESDDESAIDEDGSDVSASKTPKTNKKF